MIQNNPKMGNKKTRAIELREKPITGEFYHVYNRGVEKRKVFMTNQDRFRFVFSLTVFNSTTETDPNAFRAMDLMEVGLPSVGRGQAGEKLVDILAFAMIENHYHLLLRQKSENGITEFMRKLGTGYTNYFNLKYQRVGSLFQGKYKFVRVQTERQLSYLPYYIHLNPLDTINKNWRTGVVKGEDLEKAKRFLRIFRWSSHLDFSGQKNFPNLVNREFIQDTFGGDRQYEKDLIQWLGDNDKKTSDLGDVRF